MTQESPTLEQGKEPSQPAGQIDVDALLGELQKANITNTEDLQGKLKAGGEAGHLANLLGEARKEIAELRNQFVNAQQPVQKVDLSNYQDGQPINLEGVLENVVTKVLTKKEAENHERQVKVQREIYEAVNTIQTDEDYPLVKEAWENRMKDPNLIFKIQSGQANPVKLYQETVRAFYKEYLKKSQDAIMQLTGKNKVTPPYMESGEQKPTNLISQNTVADPIGKRLADLKAQVDKGKVLSDEEEMEMMRLVLGRKV